MRGDTTKKYTTAIQLAVSLKDENLLAALALGRQTLYDTLKECGWYWNKKTGQFTQEKPAHSRFTNSEGRTTGQFSLRITANAETAHDMMEQFTAWFRRNGVAVDDVSNDVKARATGAVHIFIRAHKFSRNGNKE